jgi:tetratricopeptide (TPR) repeat protein
MKKILFILSLIIASQLCADMLNYDKVLSNLKGLKYYKDEKYEDAEKVFGENSIQYPDDARLHYNAGNAFYRSGKLDEAENSYKLALKDENFSDRSLILQNLGNVKFQQKDFKSAIKNYRDALIADPSNMDARFNYELAARMLQRQQQQQQQQNPEKKEPSEYAKELKRQADSAVALNQYAKAYSIMSEGLKVDETVEAYRDYIDRVGNVAVIEEEN